MRLTDLLGMPFVWEWRGKIDMCDEHLMSVLHIIAGDGDMEIDIEINKHDQATLELMKAVIAASDAMEEASRRMHELGQAIKFFDEFEGRDPADIAEILASRERDAA